MFTTMIAAIRYYRRQHIPLSRRTLTARVYAATALLLIFRCVACCCCRAMMMPYDSAILYMLFVTTSSFSVIQRVAFHYAAYAIRYCCALRDRRCYAMLIFMSLDAAAVDYAAYCRRLCAFVYAMGRTAAIAASVYALFDYAMIITLMMP